MRSWVYWGRKSRYWKGLTVEEGTHISTESKYDRIHDEYWIASSKKSGSRYEKLVASVLKSLRSSDVVVHDVRMLGDSGVKHQIDVNIEVAGKPKRVLIECKDFDISGKKVGLSIIRDFWSVADDIRPDESLVITCIGFTRDARKFAKSKGIKLAVLREFLESDWTGRIRTIELTIPFWEVTEPSRVFFHFTDQEYIDKLAADLKSIGISTFGFWRGQPVYINLPDRRMQVTSFVQKLLEEHPRDKPGPASLRIRFQHTTLEVDDLGGVPVEAFELDFDIIHSEHFLSITSDRIARLILEGFGDNDIIIFDDILRRMDIDEETGEIIC